MGKNKSKRRYDDYSDEEDYFDADEVGVPSTIILGTKAPATSNRSVRDNISHSSSTNLQMNQFNSQNTIASNDSKELDYKEPNNSSSYDKNPKRVTYVHKSYERDYKDEEPLQRHEQMIDDNRYPSSQRYETQASHPPLSPYHHRPQEQHSFEKPYSRSSRSSDRNDYHHSYHSRPDPEPHSMMMDHRTQRISSLKRQKEDEKAELAKLIESRKKKISLMHKFRESDIPEFMEKIKECFHNGIYLRCNVVVDKFKRMYGRSLQEIKQEIEEDIKLNQDMRINQFKSKMLEMGPTSSLEFFEKSPERTCEWIVNNSSNDFALERLKTADIPSIWLRRKDDEVKKTIEELLYEEANILKNRYEESILIHCLMDQLLSLTSLNTELAFSWVLEMYSLAYKRKFPLNNISKSEDWDEICNVMNQYKNPNIRFTWILNKGKRDLYVSFTRNDTKDHEFIHVKPAVELESHRDFRMNVETLKPNSTEDGMTLNMETMEPGQVLSLGEKLADSITIPSPSYALMMGGDEVIICRILSCFEGGIVKRFPDIPLDYARIHHEQLDFKKYARNQEFKKSLDWLLSFPQFLKIPNVPMSEAPMIWIRRNDEGSYTWIKSWKKKLKQLLSLWKTDKPSLFVVHQLCEHLKLQIRSLFGGMKITLPFDTIQWLLVEVFGEESISFFNHLKFDEAFTDLRTLFKTFDDGTYFKKLFINDEFLLTIRPLPFIDGVQCYCSNCQKEPVENTTAPILTLEKKQTPKARLDVINSMIDTQECSPLQFGENETSVPISPSIKAFSLYPHKALPPRCVPVPKRIKSSVTETRHHINEFFSYDKAGLVEGLGNGFIDYSFKFSATKEDLLIFRMFLTKQNNNFGFNEHFDV